MKIPIKRFLTALGLGAAISLFWASPSSAEPTPVQQTHGKSSVATASWAIDNDETDDGTTSGVGLFVSHSPSGSQLFADSQTTEWRFECREGEGCSWEPTHTTRTRVFVTSGFAFSLQPALKGATVSGSELPAEQCTFDADTEPEPGDCERATVSLNATWVGTGEISRDVDAFHLGPPTFPVVSNSLDIRFVREATATGSFNGLELDTTHQASFGDNHGVTVCVNCS